MITYIMFVQPFNQLIVSTPGMCSVCLSVCLSVSLSLSLSLSLSYSDLLLKCNLFYNKQIQVLSWHNQLRGGIDNT